MNYVSTFLNIDSMKQWVPADMLSYQFLLSDYEHSRITGNAA